MGLAVSAHVLGVGILGGSLLLALIGIRLAALRAT
jgi:hypothetical protein